MEARRCEVFRHVNNKNMTVCGSERQQSPSVLLSRKGFQAASLYPENQTVKAIYIQ